MQHLSRRNPVKRSLQRPETRFRSALFLFLAALLLVVLSPSGARAQAGNEKTFSSPGAAALALYKAAKAGDSQTLNAIFGSNAEKILHSGDDVADRNLLASFAQHYQEMHRV